MDNTIKHTIQSYRKWTTVYVRFQFPQYISHKTTFIFLKILVSSKPISDFNNICYQQNQKVM